VTTWTLCSIPEVGRSVVGRGWAVHDGDEIEGRIFIHRGDDSAFQALRKGRR
jgi:hypothetical protein